MKYAVVGTTTMNKVEVIKSLESLWDARDAADDSFELVVRGSLNSAANDPETIGVIKQWIADLGCLHETAEDIESFPQVDAVLALVGQEPDDETLLAVYHFYDRGVTVYDLASQMVELQFSDQVEEEPPADEPEPPASTGITGGWPGEAPETPAAAPDPTPSREVPAKAQEDAQEPSGADSEDPAVILAGVSETDLERMGKAELKALVERLGLDADKRSPGSMINAIMEVVIAIDKGELEKAYGADAAVYFGEKTPEEAFAPQPGAVRADAPDTSVAAAEAIAPATGTQRELVFSTIFTSGRNGMTDEEVQQALGMNPSSQRPRRGELVDAGLVVDSGVRRDTQAGLEAIVWVAASNQQTPEEFLAEANAAINEASGVPEVSKGSARTVVAQFTTIIYSDGSVAMTPVTT